jgi:hypothetical protein
VKGEKGKEGRGREGKGAQRREEVRFGRRERYG